MPHDSDYGSSGNYKASIGQILSNFNPLECWAGRGERGTGSGERCSGCRSVQ